MFRLPLLGSRRNRLLPRAVASEIEGNVTGMSYSSSNSTPNNNEAAFPTHPLYRPSLHRTNNISRKQSIKPAAAWAPRPISHATSRPAQLITATAHPYVHTHRSGLHNDGYASRKMISRHISLWGGRGNSNTNGTHAPGKAGGFVSGGGAQELAGREEEVLARLSGVCEPCTGKGVVELGLVQDLILNGEKSVI